MKLFEKKLRVSAGENEKLICPIHVLKVIRTAFPCCFFQTLPFFKKLINMSRNNCQNILMFKFVVFYFSYTNVIFN